MVHARLKLKEDNLGANQVRWRQSWNRNSVCCVCGVSLFVHVSVLFSPELARTSEGNTEEVAVFRGFPYSGGGTPFPNEGRLSGRIDK